MSSFYMNRILVCVLLFFSAASIDCRKAEIGTLAANDTPGSGEKVVKVQLVSTKNISPQDSISYASPVNSGRFLATEVIGGRLLSFDKSSTTWKPVDGFPQNDWPLNFVYFKDELTGFVTGDRGTLLKTSDGGRSWIKLSKFSDHDLGKLAFVDELHGYMIAELKTDGDKGLNYSLKTFKTDDGGKSWNEVYSKSSEVGGVFDIAVSSPDICLIAVGNKVLLRTDDGGKTWQTIEPGQDVTGITFTISGIGWLVTNKGGFLRSDDGGKHWFQPPNLSKIFADCQWNAIDMDRSSNGSAVSENGCIAFTRDGKNWSKAEGPKGEHLRYVDINGPNGLMLSEQNIYWLEF